jgi:hypothetical protein
VDQQESLVHCVNDDSPASSEFTIELSLYDSFGRAFQFPIVASDAHEGLTDEEAMVARRDGSFPLVRKGSRITASAGEAGHVFVGVYYKRLEPVFTVIIGSNVSNKHP